jgi:hypothetical protein
MTGGASPSVPRIGFGTYRGVTLDVAVWDAVGADVDLSCACMFTHEIGPGPSGGLADLDGALSGALLALRRDGIFRGELMDTLTLTPASRIRGRSLLIVGLGDPDAWDPRVMARATRYLVAAANDRGVATAAIAPGMLDSGLPAASTQGGSEAMLNGVITGIDASHHLADIGLAPPPSLTAWTFGAGPAHAEEVAENLRRSLRNWPAGSSN